MFYLPLFLSFSIEYVQASKDTNKDPSDDSPNQYRSLFNNVVKIHENYGDALKEEHIKVEKFKTAIYEKSQKIEILAEKMGAGLISLCKKLEMAFDDLEKIKKRAAYLASSPQASLIDEKIKEFMLMFRVDIDNLIAIIHKANVLSFEPRFTSSHNKAHMGLQIMISEAQVRLSDIKERYGKIRYLV